MPSTLDRSLVHPQLLREAARRLRAGEVVAFPTETYYALGADATSEPAVRRVRELKGMADERAISVLVSDRLMLSKVVESIPAEAVELMERHWPGPLTIVLRAAPDLPPSLLGALRDVGARISPHPVAQSLVDLFGGPLTATSANRAGQPPARTAAATRALWPDLFVLDGGAAPGGAPSTVVRFEEGRPVVLRPGPIRP